MVASQKKIRYFFPVAPILAPKTMGFSKYLNHHGINLFLFLDLTSAHTLSRNVIVIFVFGTIIERYHFGNPSLLRENHNAFYLFDGFVRAFYH